MIAARSELVAEPHATRADERALVLVAFDVSLRVSRAGAVLPGIVDVRRIVDEEAVVETALLFAVTVVVNHVLASRAGVLRQPAGGVDQQWLVTDHDAQATGVEQLLPRVRRVDVRPAREAAPDRVVRPIGAHGDVRWAGREVRRAARCVASLGGRWIAVQELGPRCAVITSSHQDVRGKASCGRGRRVAGSLEHRSQTREQLRRRTNVRTRANRALVVDVLQ